MPQARRVLIVYSGGTIGMQQGEHGLAAAGGFAEKLRLRQQVGPGILPEWRWRELKSPLDSANISPKHWLALRHLLIKGLAEEDCDAALLLHGTDTMAYSAAALSFLLLGLAKPVLLTGSMLPVGAQGTDAWDNLFGALRAVQEGVPNGVWLYFGGQLLHGARVYKHSSTDFAAFAEHGTSLLTRADNSPRSLAGERERATALAQIPPFLHYRKTRKPTAIAIQPLYPGLSAQTLRAVLQSGIKALIVECYGSGTAPEDSALLAALASAHQEGVLLLAISQCAHGQVDFSQYAASHALQQAGVISGGCLGREAALGKLFSLLGAGLSVEKVKQWLAQNLCGEFG